MAWPCGRLLSRRDPISCGPSKRPRLQRYVPRATPPSRDADAPLDPGCVVSLPPDAPHAGAMSDALTGETVELLQQLIRNQCVNDGTAASGQEVRTSDTLRAYLAGSGDRKSVV